MSLELVRPGISLIMERFVGNILSAIEERSSQLRLRPPTGAGSQPPQPIFHHRRRQSTTARGWVLYPIVLPTHHVFEFVP